jgi:hypothetical protein
MWEISKLIFVCSANLYFINYLGVLRRAAKWKLAYKIKINTPELILIVNVLA